MLTWTKLCPKLVQSSSALPWICTFFRNQDGKVLILGNFSSQKVKTLMKGLSPAYLRVGGAPADFTVFSEKPNSYWTQMGYTKPLLSMHENDFDLLVKLTRETGLHLLFDFNLQLRFGGSWDPSNAAAVLDYLSRAGYGENIHFELGNEPSEYWSVPWCAVLNGSVIGADFLKLRQLLDQYPAFGSSVLVGPDIAGVHEPMLNEFLAVAGKRINAVTFHHYYFKGGSVPDVTNFLNVSLFSNLVDDINLAQKIIKESPVPDLPIWIGETSDCWNSGTVNTSDRYVDGFMWLEKLGMAAFMGVDVLMRQDFYGHNYGLIDNELNPNPDYWLTWLHKQLVGEKVLEVRSNELPSTENEKLRVYAHCTNSKGGHYKTGAVTMFAVNVNTDTVTLTFTSALASQVMDVYWLTPVGETLFTKDVALNGKQLKMVDETKFPSVTPKQQSAKYGLNIPPLTFGFVVFPQAGAKACL